MMNKKGAIGAVMALIAGLGGAAFWSRVQAQQQPVNTPVVDAPDHTTDVHGKTDPHDHQDKESAPDHEAYEEHGADDAHEHHEGDGHDEHEAEPAIQLSGPERDKFGVEVATAESGQLLTRIRLPGEIVLNADRVAHIAPRAAGIVREVLASVGDTVRAGEVMAWLESAELGQAKVDYLSKAAALGGSTVDLTRAGEVYHNTTRLLEVLASSPSLETLRGTEMGGMGENRGILISAYAELVFSEAAYLREKPLYEKQVASERDFQKAESEYKKADALYAATRDSTEFKIRRDLLEAERTQQIQQIELQGAKRRLYILGLTSAEIAELEHLAELQTRASARHVLCEDPHCLNCKDAATNPDDDIASEVEVLAAEEKLAWYPLRAPFDGTVIEKHLTLGEKHDDDTSAFTVADLSSVWVSIAVYQKDLAFVKRGMKVTLSESSGMPSASGVIAYVAPVVDEKTRTALARVVLANASGEWRPGLFVNAELSLGEETAAVVVPKFAIQRLGAEQVVFLDTTEGLRPVPVALGRSNADSIEILSGLVPGQRYVTQGAFELKAKIVTSGLGAHAGHGH